MMKYLLAAMMLLGFNAAAAIPKNIDTQKWNALVEKIKTEGSSTDTQFGLYKTLSQKVALPAPSRGHHVDYFSTVGFDDSEGVYQAVQLEGVSETWRIDENGHWDIDQWQFVVEVDGQLRLSRHIHFVEKLDGSILEYESLPVTEEEKAQQWEFFLNKWYLVL